MRPVVMLLLAASAIAQQRPAYQPFRYDEDWSFLADGAHTDWIDPLKYISLGRPGWFVSIGGEIRERFELLDQPGFGTGPEDSNGYFLQRYLLSSDFHAGSRFRVFTELQSGLENGRAGGPRPTDVDRLDVHQAFLDWKLSEEHPVTLRVGRQELGFGTGRLIAPAEGLNLRRSMDGVRLTVKTGSWVWNTSALRLVQSSPAVFDDVPDHRQSFWGAGFTAPHPLWKGALFAVYYLGLDRKNAIFEKGVGRAVRHTAGTHSWKNPGAGGWDYNYEGIFQWGSFRGLPVRAWALSQDTGYALRRVRLHPRFGLRADIASGDGGPRHRSLGSFDPLFPAIPVYSGPSGILGPTNLIDVSPSLRLRVRNNLSLGLESSAFWRESLDDGVYSPFLTPLRRGTPAQARYVATAPSATLSWQATHHVSCTVIYTRFLAGAFFDGARPNRDIHYFTSWVSYRF